MAYTSFSLLKIPFYNSAPENALNKQRVRLSVVIMPNAPVEQAREAEGEIKLCLDPVKHFLYFFGIIFAIRVWRYNGKRTLSLKEVVLRHIRFA